MSYSINISGHTESPEDEQKALESAKELVAGLPGVATAWFSGMHTGGQSLVQQSTAEPSDTVTTEETDGEGTGS